MLKYTREAIRLTLDQLKLVSRVFKWFSYIFAASLFTFRLFTQEEWFVLNLILAIVFLVYVIVDIFSVKKGAKRVVTRLYKRTKIAVDLCTLLAMLYGIATATTHVSAISTIFATLMIILWVLQFLIEIVVEIVDSKKELFLEAIRQDWEDIKEPIVTPFTTIGNVIKKVRGEEIAPKPEKSKTIKYLDEKITKRKIRESKKKTVNK